MKAIAGQQRVTQLPETATLRHKLLISLLAPIVLVTLISAVVTYYYAFNFATLAYDYSLFDSALDISRQTRVNDGALHVDLPSAALDMLESDTHDSIYYMVNDGKGAFVAGHRGYIDDVIMPRQTRTRICRSLAMLRNKKLENPWKKHDNIPL